MCGCFNRLCSSLVHTVEKLLPATTPSLICMSRELFCLKTSHFYWNCELKMKCWKFENTVQHIYKLKGELHNAKLVICIL